MEKRAFYTGARKQCGHYFWLSERKSVLFEDEIMSAIPDFIRPWAQIWDGGLLKNSQTPDVYDGKVLSIPAKGPWIAFVWWDRSIDSRQGSNSGLYVSGFEWSELKEAYAFGAMKWFDVIVRQKHPLKLVDLGK